ncbi:hypothetical protein C8250_006455 [Streptomyces sp. So13.3]|uniref:hypothetical protein n=1 Tax=Streptomyces TaxID=1883 RepID=UPI00164E8BA8|nr:MULTISPECIES: hypothetical protein [Streptomyces]MCZ4099321.1 hypothetical protein [Streptomyces sp. H39-C1]QNA71593.1 hypothetical protein C8250_006455 [Streptomyces sp. So13.3]
MRREESTVQLGHAQLTAPAEQGGTALPHRPATETLRRGHPLSSVPPTSAGANP